jgi:rubredoxin
MSEMRNRECPTCQASNQPRAVVDGIQEYRCRTCGLVYYGPCGCDVAHEESASAPLQNDWQMTTPPVSVENAAPVKKYPGCS